VGGYDEFYQGHASQWDSLGKEGTQSALCDIVAVPFEVAVAETE